ncbi:hypothetical protein MIR68_009412 [Amoeboaphelidium protococcarum]|nr:hypothetical protein MIR68_009412 [Amoeboaphelidium protococcarum]
MTVPQNEYEQTGGKGTDLTIDASLKGSHFDKTAFAFINCGDGGDSQQFQFTGDALKQLGHGNVLLTMAETLFEGSSKKSSLPPIDLNVDTDQFNASDVNMIMSMISEPSRLQLFNFDEDIAGQERLVNALDFFNIQLPESPVSACTSLLSKVKKYFEMQNELMSQVYGTVSSSVALALALDYIDFKDIAQNAMSYGVRIFVVYYTGGAVKIWLECNGKVISTKNTQ